MSLRLYYLPTCKSCHIAIQTFEAYAIDAQRRGLPISFEKIDARSVPKGSLYAQYGIYDVPALVFVRIDGTSQSYPKGIKDYTLQTYQILFG